MINSNNNVNKQKKGFEILMSVMRSCLQLFLTCVVLGLQVCLCTPCMHCLWRPEEDSRFLELALQMT